MELFEQFLSSLIKSSPVIGLLIFALWYLYKENKNLKSENKELNIFIRDEGIKNIKIVSELGNTIEKMLDENNDNFERLKEWISLKIK